MDNAGEMYREEARELLVEFEESLLELESAPDSQELIGRAFRAMHTFKGSGAMFGFDAIASFTHQVETVLDLVRSGKLRMTPDLSRTILAAGDHIQTLLDGGEAADAEEVGAAIVAKLCQIAGTANASPSSPEAEEQAAAAASLGAPETYRIFFGPPPECLRNGANPLLLLDELRALGELSVTARTAAIPPLDACDPEVCCTAWEMLLTTSAGERAIRDVFIFVEEDAELRIERPVVPSAAAPRRLGEILVDRSEVEPAVVDEALRRQKRLDELLIESKHVHPDQVEAALMEQRHERTICEKREKVQSGNTIRVPAEKLDLLVNIVGELVTVRARLTEIAARGDDPDLAFIAEELDRLTSAMRENAMGLRMVPVGTTVNRFRRLVHDLSRDLGKNVDLLVTGGETELDKTVIEQLNDPLVHMIRNAIDPRHRNTRRTRRRGQARRLPASSDGRTRRRQRRHHHRRRRPRARSRSHPCQGARERAGRAGRRTHRSRDFRARAHARLLHGRLHHQRLRLRRGPGCCQAQHRSAPRLLADLQPAGAGNGIHAQAAFNSGHHRRLAREGGRFLLRLSAVQCRRVF